MTPIFCARKSSPKTLLTDKSATTNMDYVQHEEQRLLVPPPC